MASESKLTRGKANKPKDHGAFRSSLGNPCFSPIPDSVDCEVRDEPDHEDDEGEDDRPGEAGVAKGHFRVPKEIQGVDRFETRALFDVTLSGFRLGVCLVLVDDAAQVPTRKFADNANNATGAMLDKVSYPVEAWQGHPNLPCRGYNG